MKCFHVLLLVSLVPSPILGRREAGRQSRGRKGRAFGDVSKLGPEGKNCQLGAKFVCHGDIKKKFTNTRASICNNGKLETMKTPFRYRSPRGNLPVCSYQGSQYCQGDHVTQYREWFLEHTCDLGNVIYRNKITGLEMVSDQILVKRARKAETQAVETNEV